MNNKINLEEIIIKHIPTDIYNPDLDKYYFSAMREACKQVLELAAENAKCEQKEIKYTGVRSGCVYYEKIVDKQSILDTINNVE